ncbi:hypothetical protein V8F06_009488 [Rhypophila decipiens]
MSDEIKWMNGVQVNVKRRSDDEWEQHKAEILESYKTSILEDVMRLMAERHSFVATKRQYIHRMEKWGIKKYNRQKTDDNRPHNARSLTSEGNPSTKHTNSPVIENSGTSPSKRPSQPTAEEIGDAHSSNIGVSELTASHGAAGSYGREESVTQSAVAQSSFPPQNTNRVAVAVLDKGLSPNDIRVALRNAGDFRTVHHAAPQPTVGPIAFPAQSPSSALVAIATAAQPGNIRASSRDTDDDHAVRHPYRLSCPYRKRNPLRFNVREYQSCASQQYPDISQLKRHVKVFHKQRPVERCPRCKKGFGTKEEVERHLLVPSNQICDVKALPSPDPEDGINDAIEDCLNGRKANTKIDSWESLWYLLFPGDAQPPDPGYHQVREHFELEQYLLQQVPESENELRLRLLPMFESFNLTNPANAGTNTSQNQEAAAPLRSLTPGPSIMLASRAPDPSTIPVPRAPDALMNPAPREPDPSIIVSPMIGIGSKQNKSKRRRVDDSASGGSTGIEEDTIGDADYTIVPFY